MVSHLTRGHAAVVHKTLICAWYLLCFWILIAVSMHDDMMEVLWWQLCVMFSGGELCMYTVVS